MVLFQGKQGLRKFRADTVEVRMGTVICFGSVLFLPICPGAPEVYAL